MVVEEWEIGLLLPSLRLVAIWSFLLARYATKSSVNSCFF